MCIRDRVKKALEEAELNLVLSSLLAEKYREKAPGAKIEVLYNAVNVPVSYTHLDVYKRQILLCDSQTSASFF